MKRATQTLFSGRNFLAAKSRRLNLLACTSNRKAGVFLSVEFESVTTGKSAFHRCVRWKKDISTVLKSEMEISETLNEIRLLMYLIARALTFHSVCERVLEFLPLRFPSFFVRSSRC